MKSFTSTFSAFNSGDQSNIQLTVKHHSSALSDLYYKYEDEPDFDCEFLPAITHEFAEIENLNELESEDDLPDSYGDDLWDADIYDPYLESTYF